MNRKRILGALVVLFIAVFALAKFAISPVHAQATSTSTSSTAAVTDASSSDALDTNDTSTDALTASDQAGDATNIGDYETAIVLDVKTTAQPNGSGASQEETYVVRMLTGQYKGQTENISSDVGSNPYGLTPVVGDKILVFIQDNPDGSGPQFFLESYDRRIALLALVLLFILTMVLLAGWQGLKIAFSILISLLLIGFVLIPSFLHGLNPIPVAMVLAAIFATLSSGLSIGWNRKTIVTVIGTVGGVVVAWLVSQAFGNWAHLSGLSSDDDRLFFDKNPLLSPHKLLFAGIIIASMGVVQDVAVSIASGVMEVRQANPRLGFKELFRSGMVVGRDHMAALANTLVFAYVGGSLSTLLLYTQYGGSWAKFFNFDSVVDEVIRSLAGTIGLVFTVPITAVLAAWFALNSKNVRNQMRQAMGWRAHAEHEHEQE